MRRFVVRLSFLSMLLAATGCCTLAEETRAVLYQLQEAQNSAEGIVDTIAKAEGKKPSPVVVPLVARYTELTGEVNTWLEDAARSVEVSALITSVDIEKPTEMQERLKKTLAKIDKFNADAQAAMGASPNALTGAEILAILEFLFLWGKKAYDAIKEHCRDWIAGKIRAMRWRRYVEIKGTGAKKYDDPDLRPPPRAGS